LCNAECNVRDSIAGSVAGIQVTVGVGHIANVAVVGSSPITRSVRVRPPGTYNDTSCILLVAFLVYGFVDG
jgi:hypothetical protein